MYDSFPSTDVPQQNILQRFFTQSWRALLLEFVLTVVITLAAGQAFDRLLPMPPQDAALHEPRPLEQLKLRARDYMAAGRHQAAVALFDIALAIRPDDAVTANRRVIANWHARAASRLAPTSTDFGASALDIPADYATLSNPPSPRRTEQEAPRRRGQQAIEGESYIFCEILGNPAVDCAILAAMKLFLRFGG